MMKLRSTLKNSDEASSDFVWRIWTYLRNALSLKIALVTIPVMLVSGYIIVKRERIDYRTTMLLREVVVPEALAKRGFTSRVVGEGVAAAIRERGEPVLKVKDFKQLSEQLSLPEFDIAGTGINSSTLTGLIDSIRRPRGNHVALSLQCERADCSEGPIYMTVLIRNHETGIVQLSRLSGEGPATQQIGDRLDRLYDLAVPKILKVADPFVMAAYHFNKFEDPENRSLKERELAFGFASRVLHAQEADAPYAHNLIAQIYGAEGRYALAEHHFGEALKKDASFGLAAHNWGNMLDGQKRYDEALAKFDEAIRRGVSSWLLPWSEGLAAIMMGRLASTKEEANAAVERFDKAILAAEKFAKQSKMDGAHPALGQIYADRAASLKKAGRIDEAIVSLRESVTAKPNRARTHFDWGFLLKQQGRLDEARTALKHAHLLYKGENAPQTLSRVLTALAEVELAIDADRANVALVIAEPIALDDRLPIEIRESAARVTVDAASTTDGWCHLFRMIKRFGHKIAPKLDIARLASVGSGPHPLARHCR
jgi:tetratricopeptide (TPR) repeat protein